MLECGEGAVASAWKLLRWVKHGVRYVLAACAWTPLSVETSIEKLSQLAGPPLTFRAALLTRIKVRAVDSCTTPQGTLRFSALLEDVGDY